MINFFSFFSAFLLSFFLIPLLIQVSSKYLIFDEVTSRKRHARRISFLGGFAIYFSLIIGVFLAPLFQSGQKFDLHVGFILLGITIIFLNGLGDDVFKYSAKQKLVVHLLVGFTFIDTNGIVQVYLLDLFDSYAITRIVLSIILVTIINSINLLDGIDGLAASISIFILMVFSFLNFYQGDTFLTVLSISLLGSLIGFLFYNLSPAKIFLGDSGSLLCGFIIGILTISTSSLSHTRLNNFSDELIIKIILATISIPVLDLLRLFFVRIMSGKSPFNGDRNHLHHILVDAGVSNNKTILVILMMSMVHVISAFFIVDLSLIVLGFLFMLEYLFVVTILKKVLNPLKSASK